MTCDRWPECGCGTQSGPHSCEGRLPSTKEILKQTYNLVNTIKMWNDKIKSPRYFVDRRNVDVLLMIARRLDYPSVYMGFPSHGNMKRAIEIYDMLFEEGYLNASLSGKMYNQESQS